MRARFIAVTAVIGSVVPSSAFAATLQVGPGKAYAKPCAAIAAAKAGDVVEVDAAGNYAGDTCAWSTDNLTIRGVGGRAKIDVTGVAPAEGKGIFVIHAPNATIEHIEFVGASVADANGAGIRHQGLNLTVRDCYFHDNQDGILGGPIDANGQDASGQGTVVVEGSEFSHNGAGDGFSHNMYIGHYASFTLRASYSHDGNVGHLVKTRALTNNIAYNRITDETNGKASYEIDVPNAGATYIVGNLVEQSATTQNPAIIAYGEETNGMNPDTHLFVVNNTIVNDKGSGTFVSVGGTVTTAAVLTNNVFVGGGTLSTQAAAVLKTNFDSSMGDPKLAGASTFDYHLLAGSPCIDKGSDPGANGNQPLAPGLEYVHPLGVEARATVGGAIDIGAYEFGNIANDGGTADSGPVGADDGGGPITARPDGGGSDAGGNGANGPAGDSGGCGCRAAPASRSTVAVAPFAALALGIMRRRRRR